jgi:hypothetical protein
VQQAPRLDEAQAVDIWPENREAVELFIALENVWRVQLGGFGGLLWLGIDWVQMESVLNLSGVPRCRYAQLYRDIKVMEKAALPILRDQSKQGSKQG